MKNVISVLFFLMLIFPAAKSQQANPQLLKEPANWSFERFPLPPGFAPDFPYKGVEELRFSPGMFNKDSADYFSYAFVAQLDGVTSISKDEIRNYLLVYFRGLCSSTAHDRKLIIDTSKITVGIEKKESPANETIYNAVVNAFGVFADGAPVKLNMEVSVLKNNNAQKTYLLFIASPNPKTNNIWRELYKIQKDFIMPV
jgi:hypothetical protein